jgi:hypothetical protein
MAKHPSQMTEAELAQDMWKRADSLEHLMAKAEMERRRTEAQLRATRWMLVSATAAALSAVASAIAAAIACYVTFFR